MSARNTRALPGPGRSRLLETALVEAGRVPERRLLDYLVAPRPALRRCRRGRPLFLPRPAACLATLPALPLWHQLRRAEPRSSFPWNLSTRHDRVAATSRPMTRPGVGKPDP